MSLPCLRVKAGVTFARIAPGGFRLLAALDDASLVLGRDLTITAGTNDHTTGRHPKGEAYDVSVQGLQPSEIRRLVELLKGRLGPLFTVLYEVPAETADPMLRPIAYVNPHATAGHLHLQVKRDTQFPPVTMTTGELA